MEFLRKMFVVFPNECSCLSLKKEHNNEQTNIKSHNVVEFTIKKTFFSVPALAKQF